MVSQSFVIRNPSGFHTRPARSFVDLLNESYPGCEVKVQKGEKTINGKSIMKMLTLGAKYGEEVRVEVTGEGEGEALRVLGEILETIYKE